MLNDARDETSGTHDVRLPEAFVDFLTSHWRDDVVDVTRRRTLRCSRLVGTRLSEAFPGDLLVVPTGNIRSRTFGAPYLFRGGSDFLWLVGDDEPDSVLVMHPTRTGHDAVLYARPGQTPRRARSTSTAWTARSGTAGAGPSRRSRACSASRPGRWRSCRRR